SAIVGVIGVRIGLCRVLGRGVLVGTARRILGGSGRRVLDRVGLRGSVGTIEAFGEDAAEGLVDARLIGPLGLAAFRVPERIVEILGGRKQVGMGEHLVPGLGPAL